MTSYPEHLQYSRDHEWVDQSSPALVGITSHAADALGDVVYLELPEAGTQITAGDVVGEIESTKSVSEFYAPVTGTVTEVNQAAIDDPALVNADPFGAGWLLKVEITAVGDLLDAAAYGELVG